MKVILVARADFYHHLMTHTGLKKELDHGPVHLGKMDENELKAAIEGPAHARGVVFQAGLVDQIIADVQGQAGNLPLLQFALTELWKRSAEDGLLTRQEYESLGWEGHPGLQGAIAQRAETVWDGLDEGEKLIARRVFMGLVSPGARTESKEQTTADTSRRAWQTEWDRATCKVADQLVEARLLTTGRDSTTDQATYDVTHEAIIRAWPRLSRWVNEYRPFLQWYTEKLSPRLRDWLENQKNRGYLLPQAMLDEAKVWLEKNTAELHGTAAKYIQASSQKQRSQRNFLIVFVIGLFIIFAGFGIWGQRNSRNASRQAATAQAANTQSITNLEEANLANTQSAANAATAEAEAIMRSTAQLETEKQRKIAVARYLAETSQSLSLPTNHIFSMENAPKMGLYNLGAILAYESVKLAPTVEGFKTYIDYFEEIPKLLSSQNFSASEMRYPIWEIEDEKFVNIYISPKKEYISKLSQPSKNTYEIRVWSTIDWREHRLVKLSLPQNTGLYRYPIAISDDSRWFSYISNDGVVLQNLIENSVEKLLWNIDEELSALKFSRDNLLVAATKAGVIKIWDINSTRNILTLSIGMGIDNVWLDNTSNLLVVETTVNEKEGNNVLVYEVDSGELISNYDSYSFLEIDKSGRYIALNVANHQDNIHIFDLNLDDEILSLNGECFIGFIPGSREIVTVKKGENGSCTSGMGKPLHLWDYTRNELLYELPLASLTWAIKIHSKGEKVAVYAGERIYVIDTKKMKVSAEMKPGFTTDTFLFNERGTILITANRNEFPVIGKTHSYDAIIWDANTGKKLGRIPNDDFVESLSFLSDGETILSADRNGTLLLWDIRDFWSNQVIEYQHDNPAVPGSIASNFTFAVPIFSEDGEKLAIGGGNGNFEIINIFSKQTIIEYETLDETLSYEIASNPDMTWVAFTGLFTQGGQFPNRVKVWFNESNDVRSIDPMPPTYEANLEASTNGRFLAIAWDEFYADNRLLHIYDTDEWNKMREIEFDTSVSVDAAFSPDNKLFAIAESNLSIFRFQDWENIYESDGLTELPTFHEFSDLFAAAVQSNTLGHTVVKLWDTDTWQEIALIEGNSYVRAISFNPEYETAASIHGDSLFYWHTKTGEVLFKKLLPDSNANLLFSPKALKNNPFIMSFYPYLSVKSVSYKGNSCPTATTSP